MKNCVTSEEKTSVQRLAEAFLSLNNIDECYSFFGDLFTAKEIEDISSRLEVAMRLKAGENYVDIAAKTGASTATISRVSKCLAGTLGGYRMVLSRCSDKSEEENDALDLSSLSMKELNAIKAVISCFESKK